MSLQATPRQTFPRWVYRFLSGQPLDGRHRTNSTFLRRADRDLTVRGRASRWHHRPGWHRSAWRTGTLLIIGSTGYGLLVARTLTIIATICGLTAGLGYGIWRARKAIRLWKHRRNLVNPLYLTLSAITGHAPADNPERHLTIPLNYRDKDDTKIRLALPPVWEGNVTQQKALSGLVARRLGGDWDARYYHHAHPPYAEFVRSPAPPDKVMFADIRSAYDASNANTLILGLGSRKSVISLSLDSDSPHFALSIGTGGGKSTTIRGLVAQLRHHGVERIDIIDPKRVSQNWAKSIPGIYVWRNIAAQMQAIHDVKVRMEQRYEKLDADETLIFPRHILIIEEQNSFVDYAQTYWDDYRRELEPSERARVPKRNPAISDLSFILYQGRQGNVNVISVLQRQSARASGGGDLRSQYGGKLLSRWDRPTWRMLMGSPYISASRVNGRALFVIGDEQHAVQIANLTETEARVYALSGPSVTAPAPDGSPLLSIVREPGSAETGSDDYMSLREIADAQVIPIRYGALRKAKSRDSEFPPGVKRGNVTLYRPGDIRLWHANRLRQAV